VKKNSFVLLDLCSSMHIALFGPVYIHAVAHLNVHICIHNRDIYRYMQWHIIMLIYIYLHKRDTCIRNRDICILISYINAEPSCLYDLASCTDKLINKKMRHILDMILGLV